MSDIKKFGGKLVLEGANDYNAQIKRINLSMKELRSEMQLCTTEFKGQENSVSALEKKQEILGRQYETAEKKVKAYEASLQEEKDKLEQAGQAYEKYSRQLEDARTELEQMKNSGKATTQEIKDQEEGIKNLEETLKKTAEEYDKHDKKVIGLQASLNAAKTEEAAFGQEQEKTARYLDEASKSADGCAKSIDGFGKEVKDSGEDVKSAAEAIEDLSAAFANSVVAEKAKEITEGLMDCVQAADKFEYGIAKVQSIAQVSEQSLSSMADEIQQVAVDYGIFANDVSEAVYQAISASVDANDAVEFTANAAKLARGGFTDLTSAVDVVTTALNAYGKEANTTEHIMDDLITTQNLGKVTVNELAQNMGTIIPTASALNVSLDQLSSGYVVMTRNGVRAAESTTYMRAMLNELSSEGSDVAEVLQEETGKSFGQLMKEGMSLGDVIAILGNSVNGDSEAFKNLFGNIRAGLGALSILNAGTEEYNNVLKQMEDNAGATYEAFLTMADTAEMADQRFQAAVENATVALGETLSPVIEKIKEKGTEALEKVQEFVEKNPALVAALAGATIAITTVSTALIAAAAAVAILKAVFGDISGIIAFTAAMGAVGAAVGAAVYATDNATRSQKEWQEAAEQGKQALEDNKRLYTENSENVKRLAERIKELQEKEKLSTEDALDLRAAVEEWNSIMPDCQYEIDATTGKIKEWNDVMEESLDLAVQQYEMIQHEEELNELVKERVETEKALAEAEDERLRLQQEINEMGDYEARMLTKTMKDYEELEETIKDLNDTKKEQEERYDELTGKISEEKDSIDELTETTQNAADGTSEATQEMIEAWNEVLEEARNAVSGTVGLFDDLKVESDLSLAQMTENMRSQAEAFTEYSENLTKAMEYVHETGSPEAEAFLQSVIAMGMDGAGYLDLLVETAETDSEAFNEAVQAFTENEEAKENADEMWAEIVATHEAGGDEAINTVDTKGADLNDRIQTLHEERMTELDGHKAQYVQFATQTVDDMTTAVNTAEPTLTTATKTMADKQITTVKTEWGDNGAGKFQKFIDAGKAVDDSLAQGIRDGASALEPAVQEMCQRIVDSVDVSGIAAKIDAQLGRISG